MGAPRWPGGNRAPSYPFKGSGKYDGGKAMRQWMSAEGVDVPDKMKMQGSAFDYDHLEREEVGSVVEDTPDTPGDWPPTNKWVDDSVNTHSAPDSQLEKVVASAGAGSHSDSGKWPPTQGWEAGQVTVDETPRNRDYAPQWPGG